jgi:hypothetical protein
VRSDFSTPSSRIRRRRSRYACMDTRYFGVPAES